MLFSIALYLSALTISPPEAEPGLTVVTVQDVMSAWEAGQAAEAGRLAEAYLTARTAEDGRLGVEGAGLAFIAGIGRVIGAGREDARSGYWMWVARQHEDVCGKLPEQYSAVIDIMRAAPGQTRGGDRMIRGGPFLQAAGQPCRDNAVSPVVPSAPAAAQAPVAVVVFAHEYDSSWTMLSARGARNTLRVPMLFEYPAGALSPSLAQGNAFEIRYRRAHTVPGGAIVLNPCTSWSFGLDIDAAPLCRVDATSPASQ